MIPLYILPRVYLPTESLGSIYGPNGELICKTMELPWLNNKNNVSCIPEDTYVVVKVGPSFGRKYGYFRFAYVKGRNINPQVNMSTILMHPATYVHHLKGCIGVGSRFEDINKDNVPDIVESSKKLLWMWSNLPDAFYLKITKKI